MNTLQTKVAETTQVGLKIEICGLRDGNYHIKSFLAGYAVFNTHRA